MDAKEVDIKTYKEEKEKFLKIFCEYQNELVEINKAEHAEIESIELEKFTDKFDEYCEKFPDRVEFYKQQRKELKEKYGEYSSYYNCPYYCVVHNKKELDELLNINEDSVLGEISNYDYWLRDLEYVGVDLQDECHKDVHGKCIGIAFFIDQDYYLIVDEKTKREQFLLCMCPYDEVEQEPPYRIVENGKDYL